MRYLASATLALLLLATSARFRDGTAAAAGGSTLNRPEDPVVLTGGDIPSLTGITPHDLVAFRWDGA
ncbi:MAG: hypothetical protein M3P30_09150 [Chloroflexota bacterium]|nr:hypothetical protein [Chloroflexota bacterium]